jgi:hypothetical protein
MKPTVLKQIKKIECLKTRFGFLNKDCIMKKKHALSIALVASMGLAATPVLSVTQGTLGATSQGEIDVILNLSKVIQISSLTDIDFETVTPDANATATESFCVYSNAEAGTYTIETTSTHGTGQAFAMKHETLTNTLPYTLTMNGGDGEKTLLNGTESTDSFTANGTDYDCDSNNNATLAATVLASDLESRPSGGYSDTLVLVVSPD